MTERIARLRLEIDEVEPCVKLRIEVPLAIGLADLHLIFQAAMGWENYHLYEFRVGRNIAYGEPEPGWADNRTRSARRATLADLLEHAKRKFTYVYDFGDTWMHSVKVEAIEEADANIAYPRMLAAEGRCPPEDCGGPWGYMHYLEAIADPEHEDHEEMIDWRGPGFDPRAVDEATIHRDLANLAKFLGRRKRAKSRKAAD